MDDKDFLKDFVTAKERLKDEFIKKKHVLVKILPVVFLLCVVAIVFLT
jgi:hypothetical protein